MVCLTAGYTYGKEGLAVPPSEPKQNDGPSCQPNTELGTRPHFFVTDTV